MEVMELTAKPRTRTGGGSGRQMRADGLIPAVLYGNKQESVKLCFDAKVFEKQLQHLRGENVMIDLKIEGRDSAVRVFLKEIQTDPLSGQYLHVDFLAIDENQEMHFAVPIHHVGDSEGVKMGGILDQHLRTVDIKCLPKHLLSHIDVDITNIGLHQSLHVSDIEVPENIVILSPQSDVVFSVLPPKKIEEVEEKEEEGIEEGEKEPEVIGEKKEEAKGE